MPPPTPINQVLSREKLKENGQRMINWYEGRSLPIIESLELNPAQKIIDIEKYVSTNISIVRAQNPCTHVWLNSYMRLYQLKKYLEDNGN